MSFNANPNRIFRKQLCPPEITILPPPLAAWIAAARHAAYLTRLSSSKVSSTPQSASLLHRRGLASGGDHHGPPKVNVWEDPLSPSKWKEEHFVLVSLAGWGVAIYGGYKFFTGGKKEKKEEKVGESAH